jgi:hypothetical protein
MAIPESQLDTWSKQGSVTQSAATYSTVKRALESTSSPFSFQSFATFLQGSYANDTNVYRESDVDVVIRLDSTYYHDAYTLPADQYAAFERSNPGSAAYGLPQFKAEVSSWLAQNFGREVQPGPKAIFIPGNGSRRDCDVLPCARFKYYYHFRSAVDEHHVEGICFFLRDGTKIVNFPKQHGENCTAKHQLTNGWFKPTVRVYKNMRNYLVNQKALRDGLAPSYFIEGLLWNVPTGSYGTNFESTVVNTFNYLTETDRSGFRCANNIHYLLRDNSHTSWSLADCQTFLDAIRTLWNNWR